ncbi:MAG: hypothetical protein AAF581_09455 [Planctomycetota bacterium]
MAKSNKSNDFLEILMLTGFFCTVFFACFGGYFWWKKESALESRDQAHRADKALHKTLSDSKSRDLKIQDQRVKESQRDAASMREAIDEVLRQMGANKPIIADFKDNRRSGSSKGKVREEAAGITFEKGSSLRAHLAFLQRLEGQKPHIKMKRLNLSKTRRGRDDTNPDQWDARLDLVTYVSETDGDKKE